MAQIIGAEYYACPPDPSDTATCDSLDYCVNNSVCYPPDYIGDIDEDGVMERCSPVLQGYWIDDYESYCTGGIDDDDDGAIDCDDTDCNTTYVYGYVDDQSNLEIKESTSVIETTQLRALMEARQQKHLDDLEDADPFGYEEEGYRK